MNFFSEEDIQVAEVITEITNELKVCLEDPCRVFYRFFQPCKHKCILSKDNCPLDKTVCQARTKLFYLQQAVRLLSGQDNVRFCNEKTCYNGLLAKANGGVFCIKSTLDNLTNSQNGGAV
ncbi:MAG: hypothetical protein FWC26_06325 [Fibromonadales bacterium]|nr:hypothetical protein [Fibromonadales bacterium]